MTDSNAPSDAVAESRARTGQQLSQMGWVRDALHDIGSPISSIILYSELLLQRETDPYAQERLGRIRDAAQKARHIVEQAAALTHDRPLAAAPAAIEDVCAAALAWMQPRLASERVPASAQIPPDLPPAGADRVVLLRALLTLLELARRACRASGEGASITVLAESDRAADLPGGPAPAVRLTVLASHAGKAWRSFDPASEAAAIGDDGLQWLGAQAAVAGLGGRLRVEPRPKAGETAFILDVPAG
jgi:signal transduction histidine kinase